MNFYPITNPITKTVTTTYLYYTINNLVIIPFQQANMMIEMFSEDKQKVTSEYLAMIGSDYANWEGDDQYLINWVNTQLQNK